MVNGLAYTEAEIQSTTPHFIELWSEQFFGNSLKITSTIFQKHPWMDNLNLQVIFLLNQYHSKFKKIREQTMWQNT